MTAQTVGGGLLGHIAELSKRWRNTQMVLPRNRPTSPKDIGGVCSLLECSCIGMLPELLLSPASFYKFSLHNRAGSCCAYKYGATWRHLLLNEGEDEHGDTGNGLIMLIIACIFHQPLSKRENHTGVFSIQRYEVKRLSPFFLAEEFLAAHASANLTWVVSHQLRETQQRLYFLRKLKHTSLITC